VKAKENLRAKCGGVNSIFLVQLRKKPATDLYEFSQSKKNLSYELERAGERFLAK